ncbi:TonB family protein [Pedobacter sp. UBA5917]|uniref:TonB family protein n=1 Tax=Pedobacter sp. UBA5917 TaxID=1947061 RepID=UPI0025FC4B03|nr:TonB family protein [Pedobacter sp. UBA5917]
MKKYILFYLLLLTALSLKAQKSADSIVFSTDTINIYGKVIDEKGKPVKNARVLSETWDKDFNYIRTITDGNGLFKLNGIKPTDWIRVRAATTAIEKPINGSRFLLLTMVPLHPLELNKDPAAFNIVAKRLSSKEKLLVKRKDTTIYDFHPFGYTKSAEYPGGLKKFYEFVKYNIKYPQKAILNNIEGTVVIKFTIDEKGNYKNFITLQDLGYGCAEEVIRVINSSKKWIPALSGITVEQNISIEIPFKLVD